MNKSNKKHKFKCCCSNNKCKNKIKTKTKTKNKLKNLNDKDKTKNKFKLFNNLNDGAILKGIPKKFENIMYIKDINDYSSDSESDDGQQQQIEDIDYKKKIKMMEREFKKKI